MILAVRTDLFRAHIFTAVAFALFTPFGGLIMKVLLDAFVMKPGHLYSFVFASICLVFSIKAGLKAMKIMKYLDEKEKRS